MHSLLPSADHSFVSRREFLVYCALISGAVFSNSSFALSNNTAAPSSVRNPTSWMLPLNTDQGSLPKETFNVSGLPGSLMKLLATAILLENHLINPNAPIDCRGITNRKFTQGQAMHCSHAHGKVALTEALGLSCNAYFSQAIQSISVSQFVTAYQRHFPGKRLAVRITKEMLPACLLGYHPAMQLTAADVLMWMQRLILNQGADHRSLVTPHTLGVLRQGMRIAARSGTGKHADPTDRYHLALKTGTTLNGPVYQSWVTGYLPFDDPQFIFCVRAQRGTSEEKAIPLLKELLKHMRR